MMTTIYYGLPVLFVVLGFVMKNSRDKAWDSSRRMGNFLIIMGILLFFARLIIEFTKNQI